MLNGSDGRSVIMKELISSGLAAKGELGSDANFDPGETVKF